MQDEVAEPVLIRPPPPPAYETAWERGLRQAKEMRRRSHKRREMDVEYEEKKASLSLTQVVRVVKKILSLELGTG